jgi:hypothetical protein
VWGFVGVIMTVMATLAIIYRVRLRICCCQVRIRHPTFPIVCAHSI